MELWHVPQTSTSWNWVWKLPKYCHTNTDVHLPKRDCWARLSQAVVCSLADILKTLLSFSSMEWGTVLSKHPELLSCPKLFCRILNFWLFTEWCFFQLNQSLCTQQIRKTPVLLLAAPNGKASGLVLEEGLSYSHILFWAQSLGCWMLVYAFQEAAEMECCIACIGAH